MASASEQVAELTPPAWASASERRPGATCRASTAHNAHAHAARRLLKKKEKERRETAHAPCGPTPTNPYATTATTAKQSQSANQSERHGLKAVMCAPSPHLQSPERGRDRVNGDQPEAAVRSAHSSSARACRYSGAHCRLLLLHGAHAGRPGPGKGPRAARLRRHHPHPPRARAPPAARLRLLRQPRQHAAQKPAATDLPAREPNNRPGYAMR